MTKTYLTITIDASLLVNLRALHKAEAQRQEYPVSFSAFIEGLLRAAVKE